MTRVGVQPGLQLGFAFGVQSVALACDPGRGFDVQRFLRLREVRELELVGVRPLGGRK